MAKPKMDRRTKQINRLTESAARNLRIQDINNTGNVEGAWKAYREFYLPGCKSIVTELLDSGVSPIQIPRKAAKLYVEG